MRCGGTTFVAMCEKMPMVAPGDGCRCRAFMTLTCFVVARGQPTHEPRRHCRRLVSSPACLVCKDFPPSGPTRRQPGAAIRPPVDDVRSSSSRSCSYSNDVWNIQEVHPGVVVQVRLARCQQAPPLGQRPHHRHVPLQCVGRTRIGPRSCHDAVTSNGDASAQSPTRMDANLQVTRLRGQPKAALDAPNRLPKLNTRVRFPSSAPHLPRHMATRFADWYPARTPNGSPASHRAYSRTLRALTKGDLPYST